MKKIIWYEHNNVANKEESESIIRGLLDVYERFPDVTFLSRTTIWNLKHIFNIYVDELGLNPNRFIPGLNVHQYMLFGEPSKKKFWLKMYRKAISDAYDKGIDHGMIYLEFESILRPYNGWRPGYLGAKNEIGEDQALFDFLVGHPNLWHRFIDNISFFAEFFDTVFIDRPRPEYSRSGSSNVEHLSREMTKRLFGNSDNILLSMPFGPKQEILHKPFEEIYEEFNSLSAGNLFPAGFPCFNEDRNTCRYYQLHEIQEHEEWSKIKNRHPKIESYYLGSSIENYSKEIQNT